MTAVNLGPDMGIEASDALKTLLAPHLRSRRGVVLAAERVERVHSASLQVLCAFARERQAKGRRTRLDTRDPELLAAVRTLGLSEALGLETER